jgi:hypothetical protein
MPVAEEVQETVKGGSNRNTALAAAAAAAAGGAATFAVRRALAHDGSKSQSRTGDSERGNGDRGSSRRSSGASSILSSAAASSWDAAADVVIPIAEDMAESAGRYLAEHGPDVVRERIVPKFIEAFEDAK